MEMLTKPFTGSPTLIEAYYVIIAVCLFGFFIFTFLPKRKALKFFIPYQIISHRAFIHKKGSREYDWSKALKRQSFLLLAISFLSVIVLLFTSFYGEIVAKVGLAILAFLVIIGGFWIEPKRR